ncbi:NAD(P)/FAD-dependent oxidoreductase [Leptolyngbya sp. NIES-2104]|uniref:NAD(P)/FAD-dependent oxidoreductase n=1 Tax=Leptolyngbya sp. NIES-2104 TaxID=1552121 RepID=UPI0006EC74D4|nr:FAD-dependent oxidoreductase [Leptolyngbya sp. NIES-2104]GAP99534.1 NAD binding site [Leptolyngbya sp. NIES-2104]
MNNGHYDIIVIGAGLAGCSSAIQLAEHGYRVLLLEQQRYPVHKLCGEFLSIEVIAAFERLGILEAVRQAGAHPIRRTYLTTSTGASFESELPGVALGLSRYQLDLMLFQRSQELGAHCLDGTVVRSVSGDLQQGFVVNTNQGSFTSSLVLGCYGKRSALDRSRPFTQKHSPFVAFKAHYTGLELPGVIELHAFPGGYCGLSQIETGEINVCWIAHERILSSKNRTVPDALLQNSVLAERFESMQCVRRSQHRLSQISFDLKGKFDGDVCMVGDSAGMITPLCGDGMAMALRSAELAIPLVIKFLQQNLSEIDFKRQYEATWNQEFYTRLRLGRLLHESFIHPSLASLSVNLCRTFPALGKKFIQATRGELPNRLTAPNLPVMMETTFGGTFN